MRMGPYMASVAAIEHGFPSRKHGLDYCVAKADTHHRHDSVDCHGTSNVCDAMTDFAPYKLHGTCQQPPKCLHVRAQPHTRHGPKGLT